ncbi:porin [Limnobacter humi]|uniref:Porin n=1 Tax=Limnobacter humi TaxID=1778671 RepID=A0ABT1WGK4_9BURK|nr:porin [Limnobacter humi]MCQ8896656.1 porin [Limnobacter humi]
MISKKIVAASILAAMGTSAHAIGFKAGEWEMDISGSVNAYYNSTSCDNIGAGAAAGSLSPASGALSVCGTATNTGQDRTTIQNGLLPGFIVFSASTRQEGYDLKAVISIDPGTTNTGAGAFSGGVGQTVGDQRRVYLQFGNAEMGTIKAGRDIGLFGQNAILNDMSLLAVGGGSGYNGVLNTTLGSIGAGYIYTEFQPQITYTTPAIGNLSLSAGVFQPKNLGGAANTVENSSPGFQGLATYSLGNTGKLWASFINQSQKSATAASDRKLNGYEAGGSLNFGDLNLTGNYFGGSGVGTTLIGFGGYDANGGKRDSQGYFTQATYKITPKTKIGVNYGSSSLDATGADTAANTLMLDETNQYVLGLYHNLTPSLTIGAEYINIEQKYQGGTLAQRSQKGEASTFAVGAIIFF